MHVPLIGAKVALVILALTGAHKGQVIHKSIFEVYAGSAAEMQSTADATCKKLTEQLLGHYLNEGDKVTYWCQLLPGTPA